MLTSAKCFTKFQCFGKKITKTAFLTPKQLKLSINVRIQEKVESESSNVNTMKDMS